MRSGFGRVDLDDLKRRLGRVATPWVVYTIAACVLLVGLYEARHFYEDDAYITLRYVRRWAAGSGPTWTDGERVQGFTHPLWLLQLAAPGWLGVDLVRASQALGLLYLVGIFVVFRRARVHPVSAVLLASLPGLSIWALGGLETVSFAFWLALAVLLVARLMDATGPGRREGAFVGGALAAATLTRPEGLGVALVVMAWVFASRRFRALAGVVVAFLAPIAAWEAWSAFYYGDLLANPVYAKVTGYPLTASLRDGVAYLAVTSPTWGWAVLGSLLAIGLWGRSAAFWTLGMALPIVLGCLLGGGDHMAGGRLLVPAAVLVVLAAGISGRERSAWAALVLSTSALLQARALLSERPPDRAAVMGGIVGRFLERSLPAGSLAAISVAGSTAFYAPSLRFIDTLGLNDRQIAHRAVGAGSTVWQAMAGHRKGDGAYVVSRAPDVIILGAASGFLGLDARQWFLTDYELLESDSFRSQYRPYSFRLDEGDTAGLPNLHLTAYLRNGSSAANALATIGIRLRGPWYVSDARSLAATSSGVGFQAE